jgi:hypothetical protein
MNNTNNRFGGPATLVGNPPGRYVGTLSWGPGPQQNMDTKFGGPATLVGGQPWPECSCGVSTAQTT